MTDQQTMHGIIAQVSFVGMGRGESFIAVRLGMMKLLVGDVY